MAEPLAPNTKVKLTEDLIKQLTAERDAFNEQSKKSDKQFDYGTEDYFYIISKKFLQEWSKMVDQALQNTGPSEEERYLISPCKMNEDIIEMEITEFGQYQLKKQIQQGLDFKIYNFVTMQIFSKYTGYQIARKVYFLGAEKKVQLYPIKFEFIYMSKTWLERIKTDQASQFPVLTSFGYKNQTIRDLLYRLVDYSKKDPRNRSPQYQNNAAAKAYFSLFFDPIQYANKVRSQHEKQQLQAPGDEINSYKMIGDIQIPPGKFMLIIELQQQKWLYQSEDFESNDQSCQFCRKRKNLKIECSCKEVKYCSEQCKQKDWRYHSPKCRTQNEEDGKQPEFVIKQDSRLGLVGLSNLGNTCFMNAALQCLIHTKDLTGYFRSKNYIKQINEKNAIGSKGKLVRSYAKFIESVLTTTEEAVTPSKLKYTIGKTKQMFSGYEQHDSQEFLLFLLDTLHEDLNRVISKPYTSGVQNEGRPDQIVAKQSWITYLKRNQSFINDIMGGQYRSEVKCPDCNNISVTFDPYLIFTVPIPSSQAKSINLYYFFSNFKSETLKITLTSKNNLVQQLIQDLSKKSKTDVDEILFYILGFNGTVRRVQESESVDKLINQKQLNEFSEEKQLFAIQFQKQELADLEKKKFFTFKFAVKEGKTLAFKRPLPMYWQNLTGEKVYNRAYQFFTGLDRGFSFNVKQTPESEREIKLKVFKQRMQENHPFLIYYCYGEITEIKNKIQYSSRTQLTDQTNVTELLLSTNFLGEFLIEFKSDPYFSFTSFKTYHGSFSPASNFSSYDGDSKSGNDESYTLQECLNQMKKSQKLVEGNEVFCTKCEDLKLAEKKMQLYKASKYLILQLRRFKQVGYEKSKNYASVQFPVYLDLSSHILSPSSPENYFIEDQQHFIKPDYWVGYDKSTQTKYQLYGVVNHHGSLNGGHYTAFGKHNQKWYKFDDRYISQVEEKEIVTNSAYILFYERL